MHATGRRIAISAGVAATIVTTLGVFFILKRELAPDEAYRQKEEPAVLEAAFRQAVTDHPNPISEVYYLSYQRHPDDIAREPSEELLARLEGLEAVWGDRKCSVKVTAAGKRDRASDTKARWGPYCTVTILKWISAREIEFAVHISGGLRAGSGFRAHIRKKVFGRWEVDPASVTDRFIS